MENSIENESRLYRLKWRAFLINVAYDIFGDGFYTVHPKDGADETKRLRSRECFGILRGYSGNNEFGRERISRWRSGMNSGDMDKKSEFITKCMTYLEECEERLTPSTPVWWKTEAEDLQFYRESSGGRSDKYWFVHLFVLSISTMGYHAGLDEYGWPKAGTFDSHDIEVELPRLFGKYFNLLCSPEGSLYDCMEEEEIVVNGRLPSPFNSHWNEYVYTDGRYSMSPARVLIHWKFDSKKTAFAWPLESFRKRCNAICGETDNDIAGKILCRLFTEKIDKEGEPTGEVKNYEDLVSSDEPHVRKWGTFKECFSYYSRGLEGDTYTPTFTVAVLGKKQARRLTVEQIDRLFLAFLVFQSEMMAAFLLNNTLAVLRKHLTPEAVESVFAVWRERIPNADKLPEIVL
ncbi:MAG: hypothetical protein ILP18_02015 [Treponema sp.]|nr:hypothetical protein [Treponema sp.]